MKLFLSCFSLLFSFFIVDSVAAAFPEELSSAYNNTLEISKQADTIHSSANFRFTVNTGSNSGINGTLNIFEQRNTSDPTNPQIKDQFIFDVSFAEDGIMGQVSGSLTFILAEHNIYLRLDRVSVNSNDTPDLQDFFDAQNIAGRWFMMPLDEAVFMSDANPFENINDPKQHFAASTGLSVEEVEQVASSFLKNDVLLATKDDDLYKGLTAYTLKLNKRGTILFFRDVGTLLLKNPKIHFSVSDLFDLKKALIRNKNLRLKVLIDESDTMVKGYVIYFASQFKDSGDTKVDINIVGEMMLDGVNQPVEIQAPARAESLDTFFENDFLDDSDMWNVDDEDELERFLDTMADTVCYLREYTAEKIGLNISFVSQSDVDAITDRFNPDNDSVLRENLDRITQSHGFLDYDDFEAISYKYPPDDTLKEQVEATVLDQCNFDYSFGFLDGNFVVLK